MSGFGWALVTAAIWGIVPLMEKLGLNHASPTIGVMVRSLGIGVGFIVCACLWSPWAAMRALGWPTIALLAGGGLLASFVGQMAFYHALKSGTLSQVAPVAGVYPLVAALLGWWVLREPITLSRGLGVLCVVAGLILLRR